MTIPDKTWKSLRRVIDEQGVAHLTLIDPDPIKQSPAEAGRIAKLAEQAGSNGIMVGGSTLPSSSIVDEVVQEIKKNVKIPVILFPNNLTGVSRYADALWFMSLLNSVDPYFLIGAQILGAPLVKKYGLEPISMGYVIVGEGGTAGIVGKAIAVPYDKPELAAAHALAGQFLGMHFLLQGPVLLTGLHQFSIVFIISKPCVIGFFLKVYLVVDI
jgi:phosphoglycerol geranylgeranyltransferase